MGETDPNEGQLITIDDPEVFGAKVQSLRSAMESTRHQIADSLDDIQHSVEQTMDWQGWVAENPWKAVGYAFAVGFYLGIR